VRVKGALHIHSTLSHDGTLSVRELSRFYSEKGYHFLAMSEHSEDMDERKAGQLQKSCAENSSESFCMIPGIEFSCEGRIHIPALGVVETIRSEEPLEVIQEVHRLNGFAILAPPRRIKWNCSPAILRAVNAVEIWNVGYDGKFLPSSEGMKAFQKMRQINPDLLAVASHDLHQTGGYYDAAVGMEVSVLDPPNILSALREGRYRIESRFFRTDSRARLTKAKSTSLGLISRQLELMRKARGIFLRWSA
jgi:hypothetical protein